MNISGDFLIFIVWISLLSINVYLFYRIDGRGLGKGGGGVLKIFVFKLCNFLFMSV